MQKSVTVVFDNVYGVLRGYKFASDFAVTFSYGHPNVGVGRDSMVVELYLGDNEMGVFRDWLERVSNDSEFEVSAVSAEESSVIGLGECPESAGDTRGPHALAAKTGSASRTHRFRFAPSDSVNSG